MKPRFNMFTLIHKGLRHALQQLVWSAGRLDAADAAQREEFLGRFRQAAAMLHRHALDEDTHIQPLIDECAPAVGAELEFQHQRSDKLLAELERLAAAIAASPDFTEETRRTWLTFVDELGRFTGDYFLHLYHEECVAMPELWKAFEDEVLIETAVRLRNSVPPPIQDLFQRYMIPALNIEERTLMLATLKKSAPAPVFESVSGTFQELLAPEEWTELQTRLAAVAG